jgi:hypothetical protein
MLEMCVFFEYAYEFLLTVFQGRHARPDGVANVRFQV